jgi:uncharacterized caspase-like protein
MAQQTKPQDVVVLYLAGHGIVPDGEEMFYFAPAESTSKNIASTGLSTAMLAEGLRNISAQRIVLVIDACQSGGAVEAISKVSDVKATVEQQRSNLETPKARSLETGVGIYIIAATLPLSYAAGPEKGESPLAVTFLQALNSAAGSSAKATVDYVTSNLPDTAAKMLQYRQVPLTSSLGVDFPVTPN